MTPREKGKAQAHDVEMGIAVLLDTLRALQLIAAHHRPAKAKAAPEDNAFPKFADSEHAAAIVRVMTAPLKTDLIALARIAYPGFVGSLTDEQFLPLGQRLRKGVEALAALGRVGAGRVEKAGVDTLSSVFAVLAWQCVRGEITAANAAAAANSVRQPLPPVFATSIDRYLDKARKNTSAETLALRVYTVLAKGSVARLQGSKRDGLTGTIGDLIRSVGQANTALRPSRKGSVGSVVQTAWPTPNTVTDHRRASIRPPISKD